jgi:arylsulfatase
MPNVIIVLTDDQGYGDLSGHGNPHLKTPALDRLRNVSVRLTDFHVAPMCTPTRSQLMSGRDALVNGAMNVSSGRTPMRADLPTMADVFAASGYATGIFGKWHLGDTYPYRPNDRGFQEAIWFPSSHIGSASDYWNNDYFSDTYRRNGRLQKYEGYCTDVFFDQAMQWMRARAAAREPFFTYLPTNAPHGPLFVPQPYTAAYAGQPRNVANFFGMIANIDQNMARLEKMLQETGLAENTILIFMTDNGGTTGVNVHNAGMRGSKISLFDGGHRVPCFIRWPQGGLQGGREIGELAEVQDILPTLIDLCGLQPPEGAGFDGASLAGLLKGTQPRLPDRMLVSQYGRMDVPRPQWGDCAVLWRQWRLVSTTELYDIGKDPGQQHDVAAQNRGVVAKMRDHYDLWWKNVEPQLHSFQPVHVGSDRESPVLLSPTEWADSFFDQGNQVRIGLRRNGQWNLHVDRDGMYEFRLRRWAVEADLPMRAAAPAHRGECGEYPAGVALPIARAAIQVGFRTQSKPVGSGDHEIVFQSQLGSGRTLLQTWFYDDAGAEISGAYYVYARRLPA